MNILNEEDIVRIWTFSGSDHMAVVYGSTSGKFQFSGTVIM
jgi:hypothetical protein